ncbi:AlpA family phage regulatory protein [Shewanella baltica]|uniref:AlpA family phage regulatory protein n=1 Tax=Shewanella TaxID=22 RepID=UPI002168F703|nr:AlpA family phage regulatory protein [Shewanella baltica]MCS6115875.1 AlpA family phage regulatory protein [Shewanella baltica]UVW63837.1 AlpA family phage regulatory protein [Shewanella baltica]
MFDATPSYSIIRLVSVIQLTGLSRSTIYDKQNPRSPRYDSTFPKKVTLGARAVGWYMQEVEQWLQGRRFY